MTKLRISRDGDASFTYLKNTNGGTAREHLLLHLAQQMITTFSLIYEMAKINKAKVLTTWVKVFAVAHACSRKWTPSLGAKKIFLLKPSSAGIHVA
jgi:hypothetical protein